MSFALQPAPAGSMESGWEFLVLKKPGRTLRKVVFIQDETGSLPRVLDKLLRDHAGSVVGVHVQPSRQGKRSLARTAIDLATVFGAAWFARQALGMAWSKAAARLPGAARACRTVASVARRHGVPILHAADVNDERFVARLRELRAELGVSISGTQLYGRALRMAVPFGIVNCHGALLPKYRGLMPSFWTLANGEERGGVSVHFVDRKLDNGPIVVQRSYRILPDDTLQAVVARSKDLAAEAILDAVRLIEAGEPALLPNPESEMSRFGMPARADVRRFLERGHAFR